MPWQQSPVNGPISDAIKSALTPVSNALGAIAPILSAAQALLNIAKAFISGTTDPTQSLLSSLISELEDLVNDTFGSGVFLLTVNPFKLEGIQRFDDFGTPLLTPAEAIDIMIESFDDLGDQARPQFSDSATVTAFGLMATAPDLAGLLDLIRQLLALLNIPEWELILTEHEEKADDQFVKSQVPDWESLRLNSFSPFDQVQRDLLELLEAARGTQVVADDNLTDLIEMLTKKVSRIQEITERIRDIIDQAAGSATGLYTFNLPPTVGGNELIQQQLRDPFLEQCVPNGYTVATLFVGGGPSLTPVDNLRKLLLGG